MLKNFETKTITDEDKYVNLRIKIKRTIALNIALHYMFIAHSHRTPQMKFSRRVFQDQKALDSYK